MFQWGKNWIKLNKVGVEYIWLTYTGGCSRIDSCFRWHATWRVWCSWSSVPEVTGSKQIRKHKHSCRVPSINEISSCGQDSCNDEGFHRWENQLESNMLSTLWFTFLRSCMDRCYIQNQSCWRVTWDESRIESRVMRVESESSHESLRSVLESSQITSHRGLESSRVTRVTQSCRVMPESDIIFAILLASYKINKPETGPDA